MVEVIQLFQAIFFFFFSIALSRSSYKLKSRFWIMHKNSHVFVLSDISMQAKIVLVNRLLFAHSASLSLSLYGISELLHFELFASRFCKRTIDFELALLCRVKQFKLCTRKKLHSTQPFLLRQCHRRASDWIIKVILLSRGILLI